MPATVTWLLALATLDGVTEIESFLSFVAPPKVAKTSKEDENISDIVT